MKTKRSIIGVLFMAMLLCFVLVGCAEQTPTISLSDDSVSMYEGESHTLTVDAVDIGEESLHWAVDQGSVVSVTPSDDGRSATVAALAAGEATVTLTCGELTVRCVFTVKAPETAYIDVVYDGETTVEQGTVLDVSKLSAASSTAGLTYRYTIRQGDGAEEALTANYTLAGKGAYTVTAYAQEARYAGSSGTLVFTVAERVSDMQITYDGKNSVSLAVRQSLELSKISVSSATVTDKELEIEYALTMPDGTQRVLKDNYVFQTAGEYSVAANIVSDGYFGSVSLKVTVDPLVSLSEKMTVKYNDDIVENDSLEIDVSSDVKISVRDFSVTLAETIPGITYTYLLDGTALSEETDLTVGMHTLTVKASGVGYEGEKTITITAYKNYAVSMVADSIAFIGELFRYQASVENETFDYAYEVKYDGEEFAPFNGTFTRSGTAALRAMIEDPTNCHRGTSKEVSVTIGELGNEYDLEQPDIVLWYGLKAASNTTQYGNVAEVVLSNDVTVSLISVNTNVATASGNVVRAESVGETELYGKIDGKYYHICSIVVYDYSDYLAVATLDDVNAVKNNPAGKYVMVNDIDLNGRAGSMVENFSGIFDGNGYALKNGELNHSSISKDNYAFFSGTTSGTIRNIAFLGWEMSSTDGTAADNWSQMGIIGMIGDSAVVENIYVEATVSVNGGANKQSKGVLIGNADKGMVRNCIVNVSYTGDYTEFGTMFGATWAKVWENCYAIVSGVDANSVYGSVSDHDDYTNYASLAALKEAQSTAFAEGGVFDTAFFEKYLVE